MVGINLSGAEFGRGNVFGKDYIYPRRADIDFYTARGIDTVRLPVRWERLQPELGGALDQAELGRLKTFLADADASGAKVIVDIHNYGRYKGQVLGSDALPVTALGEFWGRLATAIKGSPALAGYDLMNEPHDMGGATVWPRAAQSAIDAIRAVDTKTAIYVEGDGWAGADNWARNNKELVLTDPANNLIYEAHLYFDRWGAGIYSESYDAQGANPLIGVQRLQSFQNWLVANDARGFIGEVAVPKNDPKWLAVLDNFLAAADTYGIDTAYWGGGPWWGDYALAPRARSGAANPQLAVLERYAGEIADLTVTGTTGNDSLLGGRGADALSAGGGDDTLRGRAGADRLDGGTGTDTANYQSSPNAVDVDLLRVGQLGGDAAGDRLTSIEVVRGSVFADLLRGDAGPNALYGHVGNDILEGRGGGDLLDGGNGRDTVVYAAQVTIDLMLAVQANGDRIVDVENITGSAFDDRLSGDARQNSLSGGAGNDWFDGRGGGDVLDGGAGIDTVSYAGATGSVSVNLLTGKGGRDDASGDHLTGVENLIGSGFDDILRGDDAGNALAGGGGNDRLIGGGGSDQLTGGAGSDRFVYTALADSRTAAPDAILDFTRGADRIDLSALDADAGRSGNQAFAFIGSSMFSGAGQLRFEAHGADMQVFADVDGDRLADFSFLLRGAQTPLAADFVL